MTSATIRPLLPGALAILLERLADDLDARRVSPAKVRAINALLQALPPQRFGDIDRQIRETARLYHYRRVPASQFISFLHRLNGGGSAREGHDLALLRTNNALAPIFLGHANGRVREAALDHLDVGNSPYLVCALALRLNDWAGPVRHAAMDCAERALPPVDPKTLATAAWELLPRRASWARGSGDAFVVLDAALTRPDVVRQIVEQAISQPTGKGMQVVAELSRHPAIDPFLPTLMQKAVQPGIRAMAARFLIDGFASWPDGWSVKAGHAFGETRRVRQYGRRPLTTVAPPAETIHAAAHDRSFVVRATAADGLVRHRSILPDPRSLAELIARDPHAAVRQRAEFVLAELGD